jgi:hypothetical protein
VKARRPAPPGRPDRASAVRPMSTNGPDECATRVCHRAAVSGSGRRRDPASLGAGCSWVWHPTVHGGISRPGELLPTHIQEADGVVDLCYACIRELSGCRLLAAGEAHSSWRDSNRCQFEAVLHPISFGVVGSLVAADGKRGACNDDWGVRMQRHYLHRQISNRFPIGTVGCGVLVGCWVRSSYVNARAVWERCPGRTVRSVSPGDCCGGASSSPRRGGARRRGRHPIR